MLLYLGWIEIQKQQSVCVFPFMRIRFDFGRSQQYCYFNIIFASHTHGNGDGSLEYRISLMKSPCFPPFTLVSLFILHFALFESTQLCRISSFMTLHSFLCFALLSDPIVYAFNVRKSASGGIRMLRTHGMPILLQNEYISNAIKYKRTSHSAAPETFYPHLDKNGWNQR